MINLSIRAIHDGIDSDLHASLPTPENLQWRLKEGKVDFQLKTPVGDQLQSKGQIILVHHTGVSIASYRILSGKNIDTGIPSLSWNIFKNFDFQDPRKISEPTSN